MKWKWAVLVIFMLSCDDFNNCGISDFSEELAIRFHDIEDMSIRTVIFDRIDVEYANGHVIILQETEGSTGYLMPIDLSATETIYHFVTESKTYSLYFNYQNEVQIENPECEPVFRTVGLKYDSLQTNFDSVAFQVTELTNYASPHVEVYF